MGDEQSGEGISETSTIYVTRQEMSLFKQVRLCKCVRVLLNFSLFHPLKRHPDYV